MISSLPKVTITVLVTLLIGYSNLAQATGSTKLEKIHDSIKNEFETVRHINVTQLESIPPDDVVILDVREQSEFDISHLAGALRVSPGISSRKFKNEFRQIVKGKTLVFYCSVGQRSSDLADRVQDSLGNPAPTEIYNLQGGIFNWHNEKRALVSKSGATNYVHPYNSYWGRLLERPEMIRYK